MLPRPEAVLEHSMRPFSLVAPVAFLFASVAAAQDSEFRKAEPTWSLVGGASAYGKADLDSPGDLGLSRWSTGIERKVRREGGKVVRYGFRHEESNYDFGGGATIGVPDPFDDTKEDAVTATFGSFEEERKWFVSLAVISGREQGVSFSDSLYGKVGGGMLWKVQDDLDLGIGLFVRTQLEDGIRVFPFPLVEWRATDDLRIGVVRSSDPGFGLTYRISERVDGYASLAFDHRQFRLDDQPLLSDVATVDEERGLRAGLLWRGDKLDAEIFAGIVQREITIDANDKEAGDDDIDATGMVGFSLRFEL